MLDAVLAFLWASDMGGQTYVGRPVSAQAAASFIDLIYETRDGHMTVAVMSDKEWANLTRAFERPEWLEDPRFKTPALRDQNVNERLALIQEVLKTRTTAEWMARLEAADVPCAPALTRSDVIEHPQSRSCPSRRAMNSSCCASCRTSRSRCRDFPARWISPRHCPASRWQSRPIPDALARQTFFFSV
jgi:crotonobetainyl-CoA:carnitine CoA-transferase CaiB-like acyl-CoA transferase